MYLIAGIGCKKCSCSAPPFLVAEDCDLCNSCETLPNFCRWGDENAEISEETKQKQSKEEAEEQEEKPMEVRV